MPLLIPVSVLIMVFGGEKESPSRNTIISKNGVALCGIYSEYARMAMEYRQSGIPYTDVHPIYKDNENESNQQLLQLAYSVRIGATQAEKKLVINNFQQLFMEGCISAMKEGSPDI